MITLSREAIQKRIDEGTASADDLLQGKVLNEDGSVKMKGKKEVTISAKDKLELDKISADLDGKLRPLDPEEVAKGISKEQEIAEKSGLEETFKIGVASEKLKPLKAALVEITKKANSKEALKKLTPEEIEELVNGLSEGDRMKGRFMEVKLKKRSKKLLEIFSGSATIFNSELSDD